MKYINSLKYMNSFASAADISDISLNRVIDMCMRLGRVNIGTTSIFVPGGASGHATSVMLETVIKDAGYRVGRITAEFGLDSRNIVYLDGANTSIDDYNRAVAEIKSAVQRDPHEEYFREELSFAMALLICKMNACDYIILEGLSSEHCDLASVCAPYDLVIAPTVHEEHDTSVNAVCEAIRHGVREVISGNQKKSVYDMISKACVTSGVRLNFTSKTSFKSEELSSITLSFSYGDRSGYVLKSPSLLLRECSMLVIESALAIRRDGVKMPWMSIASGLASACGTGCFETLSVSPIAIFDSAKSYHEAELLNKTLDEVFGKPGAGDLWICIPYHAMDAIPAFEGRNISGIILVADEDDMEPYTVDTVFCKSPKHAAKEVYAKMRSGMDLICFGSVAFEAAVKSETLKLING